MLTPALEMQSVIFESIPGIFLLTTVKRIISECLSGSFVAGKLTEFLMVPEKHSVKKKVSMKHYTRGNSALCTLTMFNIFHDSFGRHLGGFILSFGRTGAQVGKDDGLVMVPEQIVRKVGNVATSMSIVQEFP